MTTRTKIVLALVAWAAVFVMTAMAEEVPGEMIIKEGKLPIIEYSFYVAQSWREGQDICFDIGESFFIVCGKKHHNCSRIPEGKWCLNSKNILKRKPKELNK